MKRKEVVNMIQVIGTKFRKQLIERLTLNSKENVDANYIAVISIEDMGDYKCVDGFGILVNLDTALEDIPDGDTIVVIDYSRDAAKEQDILLHALDALPPNYIVISDNFNRAYKSSGVQANVHYINNVSDVRFNDYIAVPRTLHFT